jgi:hypothetical protein
MLPQFNFRLRIIRADIAVMGGREIFTGHKSYPEKKKGHSIETR